MSSTDVNLHKRETLIEIQIQTFQPALFPVPDAIQEKKRKSRKEEKYTSTDVQ
jgi:hypothetical protein